MFASMSTCYRSLLLGRNGPCYLLLFLIAYTFAIYHLSPFISDALSGPTLDPAPLLGSTIGKISLSAGVYTDWAKEAEYMDGIGLTANTLKASMHHNYTRIYPRYFAPIRHRPLKFLEFGIFKGDSVKMWEWYFPNAELHFVDITDALIAYKGASERTHYHIFDQTNVEKLFRLGMDAGPFDIIIDDASHMNRDMIQTFTTLFPYLRPGGIYVLEDIHATYQKDYGGTGNTTHPGRPGPGSLIQMVKDLVDDVQLLGSTSVGLYANPWNVTSDTLSRLTYYARRIESIQFYPGLSFILTREQTLGT